MSDTLPDKLSDKSAGKATHRAAFFPHGSTIIDARFRRQEGDHGIGVRRRKIDGADKATGRVQYADDIQLPGMLHCTTHAHLSAFERVLANHLVRTERRTRPDVHTVVFLQLNVGDRLQRGRIELGNDLLTRAVGTQTKDRDFVRVHPRQHTARRGKDR